MSGEGNLLKILVLGDTATGKTSFIKRYVHNTHSKDHKATVGVDFVLKQLQVNKKSVRKESDKRENSSSTFNNVYTRRVLFWNR